MALHGLVWPFYGLKWPFVVFCGRISYFLAVIDPNSFGLAYRKSLQILLSIYRVNSEFVNDLESTILLVKK